MRKNGTISILATSPEEGVFDAEGVPVAPVCSWGEPIDCFVRDLYSNNNASYDGGKFKDANYEVIIEGKQDICAERVKIERRGILLGEYQVKSINVVSLHRIIITV